MITLFTILAALWGAALAGPAAIPVDSPGQTIANQENGTLTFRYPVREGVRGKGRSIEISLGTGSHSSYFNGCWDDTNTMTTGPAQVTITFKNGQIIDLDLTVGASQKAPPQGQQLGFVEPGVAAAYFLNQAPLLDEETAGRALLAGAIARDAAVAAPLLNIVETRTNHTELRRDALFWMAVLASEKALAPIRDLIDGQDEDLELRESAVFALAQLDRPETLPMLLEIARNDKVPQLQRAAFFALAEHDTPEVHRLFEEILLGP